MSEQQAKSVFNLEKLFVKDLSLEVPLGAAAFLVTEEPEIEMRLATNHAKLEDDFCNVDVTVTITAKLPNDRVLFLCEVTQSGIFLMKNIPAEDEELLLNMACPNILYPYVREVVSSATTRAGFPPVVLAPINFEAMHYQNQQAEQEQKAN